jgi:hypothetical protein
VIAVPSASTRWKRHGAPRFHQVVWISVEFRSNSAVDWPLAQVLELLKRIAGSCQRLYQAYKDVPLDGVVRPDQL